MEMTGAKILLECLLEQDVDTIFGYPGGTILNVYDELYKYSDRIHHILTTHEQGAAHAADGYARSTNRVGVCFATSGPGATNLVTGIATAYMDSSPVVFITCNVADALIGKDSFQEVDIVGITMPITKCSFLVRDVDTLADVVRQGFALARSGRPGPVLIDIMKHATQETAEYSYLPREEHYKSGRLARLLQRTANNLKAPEPNNEDLETMAQMIEKAERPLIICGGGVVRGRAHDAFNAFAKLIDAPVAVTMMGTGAIRGRNPLVTGLIGMHGTQASNTACDSCDLLIAVGCRFSDRVTMKMDSFAARAKIVQIDIDRSEINKNVLVDHHIVGDANRVLRLLNQRLTQGEHSQWKEEVFSHPTETEYDNSTETLTPKQVLECIAKAAPQDTIVATDVGQHQMWAIQHFRFDYPGQLLTSGGFGAMGFGLGAALGAKAANPDKTVVHITGDGCFRMNSHELSTEEHYDLPIITVVFNNGTLGMVRQWQTLIYDKRYSATELDRGPNFVKLAEAYNLKGRRVHNVEEMQLAMEEALSCGCGYVIDCAIDTDEMVRPMVQAGAHITNFLIH